MRATSSPHRYLLDVNVLLALTTEDHVHHELVRRWFYASSELRWALCALTEAGFLRNATAPRPGQISMGDASAVLQYLARHPGYQYQPVAENWHVLSRPFSSRIYGTKQVTDAFLLGLAVNAGMVLATMDKAILHLAGVDFDSHVMLLQE